MWRDSFAIPSLPPLSGRFEHEEESNQFLLNVERQACHLRRYDSSTFVEPEQNGTNIPFYAGRRKNEDDCEEKQMKADEYSLLSQTPYDKSLPIAREVFTGLFEHRDSELEEYVANPLYSHSTQSSTDLSQARSRLLESSYHKESFKERVKGFFSEDKHHNETTEPLKDENGFREVVKEKLKISSEPFRRLKTFFSDSTDASKQSDQDTKLKFFEEQLKDNDSSGTDPITNNSRNSGGEIIVNENDESKSIVTRIRGLSRVVKRSLSVTSKNSLKTTKNDT